MAGREGSRRTETTGSAGSAGAGARPLVLPETFDGTGSWSDWCFHFENVAAVNGWDSAQKLQWLRVRLTGRAQKALHRLPGPATASYEATRNALRARFEPESRLWNAESARIVDFAIDFVIGFVIDFVMKIDLGIDFGIDFLAKIDFGIDF